MLSDRDFITKIILLSRRMKKNDTVHNKAPAHKNLGGRFTIFRRVPLLLSLTRRAFLFSAFFLAAQLILFFSGNFQNFLDENLNVILFVITCTSIAMGFFCFAAVFECIYYIVTSKKSYFYVHLVIFIIFLAISIFLCLFSTSIEILSGGLGQQ